MIWNRLNPRRRMERKGVGKRTIGTGKWIKLVELEYTIGEENENNLKWESVERITKSNSSEIDGVEVIALIDSKPVKQIILVSQFRPPLNSYCLEFPAGLVTEEGETEISAAMRELQEETGYYGYEAEIIDQVIFFDSGVSNCNAKYVKIKVDCENDARNFNPKPIFQDEEDIVTHLLPFDSNLFDALIKLCDERKFVLDARLASVALGMKLSLTFN